MKLLGKRVILRFLDTPKKASVIITNEEKPYTHAEVVAAGVYDLKPEDTLFKKGDKVLVNRHITDPIEWEGEDLRIIEPHLIIAKE